MTALGENRDNMLNDLANELTLMSPELAATEFTRSTTNRWPGPGAPHGDTPQGRAQLAGLETSAAAGSKGADLGRYPCE